MTVKILTAWNGYPKDYIGSVISPSEEARLVGIGFASYDLDGVDNDNVRMPVTATTNPLTGGISLQSGGLNLGQITGHAKPAEFTLPTALSGLEIYSVNGAAKASIGPHDLIDTSGYTNTYYVDGVGGNDANSGATWALRKKSIGNAMRTASTSGLASRILVWAQSGLPYYRQIGPADDSSVRASAVPILLEAMSGRVQTGCYDNLTWTKTGGLTYTYQATRSSVIRCVNPAVKSTEGLHSEYTWVASSAAVDALEGSWYTDNTTVFVRPHGNSVASIANTRAIMTGVRGLEWQGNQNLVVRGFDFEGGPLGTKVSGGSTNVVVFDDCTFRYSAASNTYNGGSSVTDGLQVLGVGLVAAFNCAADRNSKDGFNFHSEGSVLPNALLVNCTGTLNGLNPSVSNNGFTCHDGVAAISVGCDWRGNYGIGSGHVNDGTKIWSICDISGDSMGDYIYSGGLAGGFGVWSGAAKIWLDSCIDTGSEVGIYRADTSSAYTRNHKGSGRRSSGVTTF